MSTATQSDNPVLSVHGLAKAFGAQVALRSVDFDLRCGEIHALLGENGAGKSTMIKVLAGAISRDDGSIVINGTVAPEAYGTGFAAQAGMSFVHQDLGLIETLSVAENVALETGYARRAGLISFRRTERAVAGLLDRLGIDVDPSSLVADLSQDQKVMVAVARALSQDARIIVLDEVSASLPAPEMASLTRALRASQVSGVAYVYVTHRIEEVFELADRVTVLRDGKVRATARVSDTTHDQVVEWIVGEALEHRSVDQDRPQRSDREVARLSVRGLTGTGLNHPVTFDVAEGEIVGVCGLIGSGTRELAALLGGIGGRVDGDVLLDGRPLHLGSAERMRKSACSYVPGDRQRDGVAADLSIRENLFMSRALDPRIIWSRSERESAQDLSDEYEVRPVGSVERPVGSLSGGNQQKVVLGRALRSHPKLIVLEDPTAGVDVGSRVELHRLIRAAAAAGTAVLLVSTDFEEVASQAHRAMVMCQGRISAEIDGPHLTAERLAVESYAATDSTHE